MHIWYLCFWKETIQEKWQYGVVFPFAFHSRSNHSGHACCYTNLNHIEHHLLWCWRRMEKISWTDHVRNEEVLLGVNGQRNILHEIRKRKANWIGHILRRNCLLKQVIEWKIKGETEVTRRRGRRRKKLLDELKDRRGYSYLKEEVLDRTMWMNRFGEDFGPVVRQNTEWMRIPQRYLLAERQISRGSQWIAVPVIVYARGRQPFSSVVPK